jgi:hypothetical protein
VAVVVDESDSVDLATIGDRFDQILKRFVSVLAALHATIVHGGDDSSDARARPSLS